MVLRLPTDGSSSLQKSISQGAGPAEALFHSNAGSTGLCTSIECAGQNKAVWCVFCMVAAFM